MDFLAICQGLGVAIAAGLVIGVVLPPVMPPWGAIAGAAPLGIVACALVLAGEDEAIWPALPVGSVGAGLAAAVSRDVASGAARRARGGVDAVAAQAPAGVTALVALAAALVAVASIVVPPAALVALAALVWLWLSRRRRSEQKHEGLRVLR
jgi:hypothetical protein